MNIPFFIYLILKVSVFSQEINTDILWFFNLRVSAKA